jgi:hypothetical protein
MFLRSPVEGLLRSDILLKSGITPRFTYKMIVCSSIAGTLGLDLVVVVLGQMITEGLMVPGILFHRLRN